MSQTQSRPHDCALEPDPSGSNSCRSLDFGKPLPPVNFHDASAMRSLCGLHCRSKLRTPLPGLVSNCKDRKEYRKARASNAQRRAYRTLSLEASCAASSSNLRVSAMSFQVVISTAPWQVKIQKNITNKIPPALTRHTACDPPAGKMHNLHRRGEMADTYFSDLISWQPEPAATQRQNNTKQLNQAQNKPAETKELNMT